MYVLTNIEVETTHKVLKNLGPSIENDLPERERKTLRDLIEGLGVYIDNGLPESPDTPDNSLPCTDKPDNSLPTTPATPDNTLPPTAEPKA